MLFERIKLEFSPYYIALERAYLITFIPVDLIGTKAYSDLDNVKKVVAQLMITMSEETYRNLITPESVQSGLPINGVIHCDDLTQNERNAFLDSLDLPIHLAGYAYFVSDAIFEEKSRILDFKFRTTLSKRYQKQERIKKWGF